MTPERPWREPAAWRPTEELDAERLLRTLVEHDVEFVVIGGLAVAYHGFFRGTKDVDIVPAPESANRRRLYEALRQIGAEPIEMADFRAEELPVPFAAEGLDEGGNWALRTSAGRIAVLQWVAGVDGYDGLRGRAVEATLPAIGRVLFAGYDDLIAMKKAAGRPRDLEDLETLARVRE